MTTAATNTSDLLIVDADTHLSEPWDLWTSRAPERFRDRVPQVREVDGALSWVFDGFKVGPAIAAAVVDRDMVKQLDVDFLFTKRVDEVAAAASEVGPRLELMDEQGIWAHLVYPNTIGFGGQQLGQIGDLDLRNLTVTLYNDASADMQRESGNRLFPIGVVPWWDIDTAVKEIERIAELGLAGLNMVSDPHEYGLPDLSDPLWTPMFDAMEATGLPLNFHIGASPTQMNYYGTASWPSFDDGMKQALGSVMLYLGNARVLANFIYGGIFERHPTLKFVSVESGVSWLPFFLQALDYQLLETAPHRRRALSLKPSEYFRRQCAACFWFEDELLLPGIEYLGVDNCMFETDFPHPTCLYPDPLERALKVFEGADPVLKKKVFGANAARIYNLPVPAVTA
jgi:predicted TIM-barrel fold metal-dependent hydrolase